MIFVPFRQARIASDYDVKVALQEYGSCANLTGLQLCTMVEISEGGARLVLSNMLLDGRHLFFTTLNSDRYHLLLVIDNPEDDTESFEIAAHSVWMDSCLYKKHSAFTVGLRFHEKQKRLFRLFKK